jgi:thioredoxin 1
MPVQEITSDKQFNSVISQTPLVVIDFYAEWCGPCKQIAPNFTALSNQKECSSIKFFKLNIDTVPEIAQLCKVKSIPTFISFKNGKMNNMVGGANIDNIVNMVKQLLSK